MSNAISSHGTLLQLGDGAPGTYGTIGEVQDIKGPEVAPVYEETTNHSSGGWKEQKPVLLDPGKLTCKVNYINDATQQALRAAMYAKTLKYFKVLYPDATYETFTAFVKITREAKVKGILTGDVELTITGAVTPG